MPLPTETPMNPLAQAPPDRPSRSIEDWAKEGEALLFGDNVLDMNERRIVRGLIERIAIRSQTGGIGMGATPPGEMPPPPASIHEMNQNTEDFGTVAGAEPRNEEAYL